MQAWMRAAGMAAGLLLLLWPGAAPVVGGPGPASPGGNLGAPPYFSADAGGPVRVNIVYRRPPGWREEALLHARRGKVRRVLRHVPVASMEVPAESLPELLQALKLDPSVLVIEPEPEDIRISTQTVPWGIVRVEADQTRLNNRRGTGVKVAVLDTGIDYNHPDLKPNYKGGYDAVNHDGDPMDDNGHGTHVAGTIAAADNRFGVVGVAPGASLYAVKCLTATGGGAHEDFAAALDWCIANQIEVANFSAGSPYGSTTMSVACREAFLAGITIVAASGNMGVGAVQFPAAYNNVLGVGASGKLNKRPFFSNYGPELDLVAPGVDVLSDKLGGGTVSWDGTSMAAPHVSGVAALVIESGISSPTDVFARLESTAIDLGAPGRDNTFGWGLVDAKRAVFLTTFLTAPAAGEILASGSSFDILWDAVAGAESYRLEYTLDGGVAWSLIIEDALTSPFVWSVPTPAGNRPKSQVRISAKDAAGTLVAFDVSARFTVEVVRLLSPNGGELWASGMPHTISWALNQTAAPVDAISLDLSIDGGKMWVPLVSLPPGAATFEWTPAMVFRRPHCLVRVVPRDASQAMLGVDRSDAEFTVSPDP